MGSFNTEDFKELINEALKAPITISTNPKILITKELVDAVGKDAVDERFGVNNWVIQKDWI